VFGADEGHVAFEIAGRPRVFALEQSDNLLLCRGLLGVCGVERLLGGIDGGSAGLDKIFWRVSVVAETRSRCMKHTLLLDLPPQGRDTRVVGASVGVDLLGDCCKLR
jgi:hypothetical protein